MVGRPTGTVTFLFTDIEGSTRLWEEHPNVMGPALERHDQILRSAIESHGGYVFSTAGDAFAVAFTRAGSAVDAAVAAQSALLSEPWPEGAAVRVRMGLHTGEAQERGGDYFGPTLNRAARLMASGHGGQVLLSGPSKALVDRDDLVDLGEHRLKDLQAPERIWQLGSRQYPRLQTLDTVRHNLPVRSTPLVGRSEQIKQVGQLLSDVRLVTLVGMGGAGKTSLGLAAAADLIDRFTDGVFLVELQPLSAERVVASAVGEAAGMRLTGISVEDVEDTVVSFLARRDVLLVIDNCEHLVDGVAELTERLLSEGDQCRVLATSREPLDVEGEHLLRVGPLPPEAATRLIIDRTKAVRDEFDPSAEDAATLKTVALALDGIPLALELASAQLAHLSPADLLARLEDRFNLLQGGRRRRRSGRRTLAAMMDWSWDLLDEEQQLVLAELSVFVDGWSLEAAEAICRETGGRTAVVLGDLYARSLVTRSEQHGRVRYGMLETVRLYAREQLKGTGRTPEIEERHALYWCQDALPPTYSEREICRSHRSLERLIPDVENARLAATWLIDAGRAEEAVPAMTIWAHMAQVYRSSSSPAADLLPRILAADLTDQARAHALIAAAHLSWGIGDIAQLEQQAASGYELAAKSRDDTAASVAAWLRSFRYQIRSPQKALEFIDQAVAHGTEAGRPELLRCARAFGSLIYSFGLDDPDQGARICKEILEEDSSHDYDQVVTLTSLMAPLCLLGQWDEAADVSKQASDIMFSPKSQVAYWDAVEQGTLAFELGRDPSALYQQGWQSNSQDGTATTRPDHLLLPLGRAVSDRRWSDAAGIIELVRQLGQSGVEFQTPTTVAIYLRYRNITLEGLAPDTQPADLQFQDVVEAELTIGAAGDIAPPRPDVPTTDGL